ncbi:MAG: hypothetical protein AB8G14_02915 [Ilumatobacter sp.]
MSGRARHHSVAALLIATLAAACAGASDGRSPEEPPTSRVEVAESVAAATDREQTSTEVSTGPRPTPVAIGDLSAAPFITFAPIGPKPQSQQDLPLPDGSADYWDLFVDDAPWQSALEHVDAVKIHSWQVRHFFGTQQVIDLVDFLAAQELPLIVEMEPLKRKGIEGCDHGESFEGPLEIFTARTIKRQGGTIAAIAIEQPYSFAHKLQPEGECRYSVEEITDELITWVGEIREIFPDVKIGSIEAIWSSPATTPEDMAIWMDAYEAALGEPLAFLNMDVNWDRRDWAEVAAGVEAEADARGVPFGLLYNGGLEQTNDGWLQATAERVAAYEAAAGGTPTHVTFQSWMDQPDRVLPENDPGAFTHLINRYVDGRSALEVEAVDAAGSITGRVVGPDGDGLAGLTIETGVQSDPNAVQELRLAGRPPADADRALIVIRANAEDAVVGETDVRVQDISFVQGDGVNRVVNGDFAAGENGWGGDPATTGTIEFMAADSADGGELRLRADAGQPILLNGEPFDVDADGDFEFTVSAIIGEVSNGEPSGQIAVAFLDGDREVGRRIIELAWRPIEFEPVMSDAEGSFTVRTGDVEVAGRVISVSTPGDVTTWPASITFVGN